MNTDHDVEIQYFTPLPNNSETTVIVGHFHLTFLSHFILPLNNITMPLIYIDLLSTTYSGRWIEYLCLWRYYRVLYNNQVLSQFSITSTPFPLPLLLLLLLLLLPLLPLTLLTINPLLPPLYSCSTLCLDKLLFKWSVLKKFRDSMIGNLSLLCVCISFNWSTIALWA